jgi:hypothetical protein
MTQADLVAHNQQLLCTAESYLRRQRPCGGCLGPAFLSETLDVATGRRVPYGWWCVRNNQAQTCRDLTNWERWVLTVDLL